MSTLDYNEIGDHIRAQRIRKGLKQKELAELVHVSSQHISHIETGSAQLSLPALVDIANALGSDVDALLGNNLTERRRDVLEREIAKELAPCGPELLERVLDFCRAEVAFAKKLTGASSKTDAAVFHEEV